MLMLLFILRELLSHCSGLGRGPGARFLNTLSNYLRMSHRGFLFGFVGSLSHPVATFVVRLRYFCGGSWLCFGSHGLRILFLVGVICHIL